MSSTFHSFVSKSIRWLTYKWGSRWAPISFAGRARIVGIQLSVQTFVLKPDFMFFLSPSSRRDFAAKMLHHTKEGEFAGFDSMILEYLKYLPFRTQLKRELGYRRIRHSCFANSAMLNSLKSRKPKAPSSNGIHTLSQASQWRPLLLFLVLHQNFAIAPLSLFMMVCGSKKHDMTYVGSAWATDLIRISFPPLDRNFADQELILLLSRSWTKEKTSYFDPQIFSGRPRYIPIPPSLLIPMACFRAVFNSGAIPLQKKTADFSRFNC